MTPHDVFQHFYKFANIISNPLFAVNGGCVNPNDIFTASYSPWSLSSPEFPPETPQATAGSKFGSESLSSFNPSVWRHPDKVRIVLTRGTEDRFKKPPHAFYRQE